MAEMTPADIAAVNGNNCGWGGFGGEGLWLFGILALMGFGGNGFFGNGRGGEQYATTADVQRSVDLNSILRGQSDLAADMQRIGNESITATKDSAYNNLSEIRDVQAAVASGFARQQECCCDVKQAIMENRYLASQNTATINATTVAENQKVLDKLAAMELGMVQRENQQLYARVNRLETQQDINQATCGVVRYPVYATTANPWGTNWGGCGRAAGY